MTSLPFRDRHIGVSEAAEREMLDALGFTDVESLLTAALPPSIVISEENRATRIPDAATEEEALGELRAMAQRNRVTRSLIGLGYYDTHTPAVITRNVLENPSWYTAYTPYQPEISQGRLEALINFQTMVSDLTGMATANASMLDEATAVVEGMLLARRATKSASVVFAVDKDAFPQTKALLTSRAEPVGITIEEFDPRSGELPECFGCFIQYPGASGEIVDPRTVVERAQQIGALVVVAADLLALALVESPGALGADIVVGTSQRFGVPLGFGGPHAGYLAVRSGLERQMPGRLVGVSIDAAGNTAYRLSLQAREQHIRREKATSNICTAQVLLAVMAAMYAVYHGPEGIKRIAHRVHQRAADFVASVAPTDARVTTERFFDTVRVHVPGRANEIYRAGRDAGYTLLLVDEDTLGISFDETTTPYDVNQVAGLFGANSTVSGAAEIPSGLERSTAYLDHPVFAAHRSETSMMRYLKRLADQDYALDRGMIPLGSCTMKLNAATEMEAVTWPEFSRIHPFAPREDVEGYLDLIDQLESWLTDVTGYDTVSLQPNAGSQGELAGLLAIRGYHLSRGDEGRTVCLIPSSAHGTNAASAVLAGMRVVVVACDDNGNVDVDDLIGKIEQNADQIAALMITYPSTHGVYESRVREICDLVHAAGGQVYVDGANMNALVGHARFGDLGGDVSHLNLHKTFCIPHGGGGPGVGPVAAKAHLAPFLPGHPFAQRNDHPASDGSRIVHGGPPVSAAPYGSPSILAISWAYVRMMGQSGLAEATAAAVLSANYIASRLSEHFPVLYTGESGLVAHECILDLRPLRDETGITVDDVAKRLIDYGFHAPTMSFPVAGTLMVEPTESEDIVELERFIQAMVMIKDEALAVGSGRLPADDNPLVNAPHTAESLTEDWGHPYSRRDAVFPVRSLVKNKYWPPVRRIDQAFGDRNLVCACPPPEAFE